MLPMSEEKHALFKKLGLIYKDTHASTELTEQPSARLNLQAFLNNDARCWEQSADQVSANKKAIIVTSWLLAYPGVDSNASAYYETLIFLIKEGFSLYFPTDQGLEIISRSSSFGWAQQSSDRLARLLKEFTPINDMDALGRAVKLDLTRDRMMILSSQRLMALTQTFYAMGFHNKMYCRDWDEDNFFVSDHVEIISLNRAMSFIKLETLEQVQNTDDRYFFHYPLDKLAPEIPDAILNKIDLLALFEAGQLIDSEGRNDKAIISQMRGVSSLSVSNLGGFNAENFRRFLAVFPDTRQIKRIDFDALYPFNDYLSELKKYRFESLEELSLYSFDMTIDELDMLLTCAPDLLHLSISRSCYISQTIPATPLTLPKSLQSFRQYGEHAPDEERFTLTNIVSQSSDLKAMTLILDETAYQFICKSNLCALESLSLDIDDHALSSISAADLLLSLESAENLSHLSLDVETIFNKEQPSRPFTVPFGAIKSLDVTIEKTTDAEGLYHFLNAAKSMETLNCLVQRVHFGKQVVLLQELQQLRQLTFNFSQGNQTLLFDLLNAAPYITELTIKKLDSYFHPEQEPVKSGQLKSLTLQDTNMDCIHHYLEVLATQAPALETLTISTKQYPAHTKREPQAYCLSALKVLNIQDTSFYFNLHDIIDIVGRAPNLEAIVLPTGVVPSPLLRDSINSDIEIVHYFYGDDYTSREPSFPQHKKTPSQALPNLKIAETIPLDGDIAKTNAALNAQVIFKAVDGLNAPKVSSYHLSLYKWSVSRDKPPLQLYRPIENHLETVENCIRLTQQELISEFETLNAQQHSQYYYGQYTYQDIEAGRWYQLPALSTNDSLLAIGAISKHERYELRRDHKTGYYFVKFNQAHAAFTLNYIIHSQPEISCSPPTDDAQLSEPAKMLRDLRFKDDGSLDEAEDTFSALIIASLSRPEQFPILLLNPLIELCSFNKPFGEQPIDALLPGRLLNALLDQREGACRHRANLFVALASALNLEAMIVDNHVHQFSIFFDSQQAKPLCIDFGGAPARLEIMPMASPVLIQEKPVFDANNPFQTWNTRSLKATNAIELAEELNGFHAPIRQLVIMNTYQDIKGLLDGMLKHPDAGRCFFSKDLDSLGLETVCLNDGLFQRIDSPLAEFLKQAQINSSTTYHWYINWSDPEPKHVAYNSIIDDHARNLKGLSIAKNVKIVALCDRVSSASLGEDIYSRMDAVYQAQHIHLQPLPQKPMEKQAWNENENGVLLAAHEDWQQLLIGRYSVEAQTYSLEEGALVKAIRNETPLVIYNPPWDDRDFCWFISELQARRGFYFNGHWQNLPQDFALSFAQANLIFPNLLHASQHGDRTFILNQESFTFFFKHYLIRQDGQIGSSSGYIASAEGGAVDVMVTEKLTEEQWFQLFKSAEKYQVALRISKSHSLELPSGLPAIATEALEVPSNVSVILSDDLDFAASQFPGAISVSIDLKSNADGLFFHASRQDAFFHGQETDLLQALREAKDVIIKGHFSKTMQRRLQTLFTSHPALYVNGVWIEVTGRIVLITEDSNAFEQVEKKKVDYDVKIDLGKLPQAWSEKLSALYQQLDISPCYSHFLHTPAPGDEQTQWFNDLIEGLQLTAGIMKEKSQATEAKDVLDYLARHPFVFLCSESGEGKSYFVHHVLKEHAQEQGRRLAVYNGLEKLKDWASQHDTEAVLFIDEANLLAEHFMLFDSFAKGEREIWIEGNRYPLGAQHHLIFAGNPKQYEGRFEADLFRRFPCYLQFHSQGLQHILEPLLFFIEDNDEKQIFLDLIDSYYQMAHEAGLQMTARNAQMICLRYFILKNMEPVSRCFKNDFLQNYALLSEFGVLCMDKKETSTIRQALKEPMNWRENKSFFHNAMDLYRRPCQQPADNYVLTPSRQKAKRAIETFLSIRQVKLKSRFPQDAGINGILFEGEPGLGKSQLCMSMLKEHGISYLCLAPGDHQKARDRVLHAFHQGMGVIVDEFNSFADEELWNAVLSGYDLDGKPANQPGFFVFATQNPISLHGRKPLSPALTNRMMLFKLSHYNESELVSILEEKHNIPHQKAVKLTEQYLDARHYASQQRLFPTPNPRAIFSNAQQQARPECEDSGRPQKRSKH